jgi:hypothetical protein
LGAAGKNADDDVAADLSRMPIELVDADLHLAKQAAVYKATNKMSYANAFAAALAKMPNSSRAMWNSNCLKSKSTG